MAQGAWVSAENQVLGIEKGTIQQFRSSTPRLRRSKIKQPTVCSATVRWLGLKSPGEKDESLSGCEWSILIFRIGFTPFTLFFEDPFFGELDSC